MKYVHTNIISRDWRQLVIFYEEVFDCKMVPPIRNQIGPGLSAGTGVADASLEGAHLRLPGYGDTGPTLEIYQYGEVEDSPSPVANRKGFGHIAFEVDDVAGILKKIIEHGGQRWGEVVDIGVEGKGGLTFTYARDPDGNLIELQSWK